MSVFPISELEKKPTPFYYYDLSLLRQTLRVVAECSNYTGYKVHYAVKSNANPRILREISAAGFGADTVSAGEIEAALDAGFENRKIVFAGVGKSDEEIRYALVNGIGCINVESAAELAVIEMMAKSMNLKADVALRVNPNIDAHTHHYITTGMSENKFGIDMSLLDSLVTDCINSPYINLQGLHFHIGSQITIMEPYELLCHRINELQISLRSKGVMLNSINVGGGLGIDYDNPDKNPIPDFKSYFDTFHRNLNLYPGQELHFELGRAISGQCGSLISRVLYVKEGVKKRFVILDAGMTELIRPALYQAHHTIQNLTSDSDRTEIYDVVGPVCESSDCFSENERLPITKRGDIMVIRSAGAYGESMASHYNCRSLRASYFNE